MTTALELQKVTITDRVLGSFVITGYQIGRIDTREGAPGQRLDRPRPRWGVNTVWKLRDGTYVLVREAFSTVYHTAGTSCRTKNKLQSGEPATVADLPDDAVPCWVCHPAYPDELGEREQIRFEHPRRTIDQCQDGAQVIARLTTSRKHSGVVTTETPEPTRALLLQCRSNDPRFATAQAPAAAFG